MSEQKLREALERQAILTHNKRTYCRLCEWWDIHAPDCVFTLLAASPATVAGAAPEPTNWKGVKWRDSIKANNLAQKIALHFAHDCNDSMCGEDADASNCESAWVEDELSEWLDEMAAPDSRLATETGGTMGSDAMENLADYLLRTSPPSWNYETVLRLAKAVAAGAAPKGFKAWWADQGCGDKEMKAIARTGYQSGQAALLTGLRGLRELSEKATAGLWELDGLRAGVGTRGIVLQGVTPQQGGTFDVMDNIAFAVACVNFVRDTLVRTVEGE